MDSSKIESALKNSDEKTCFICEKAKAKYHIKGMPNDCYCEECAIDSFGSVDYLEKF